MKLQRLLTIGFLLVISVAAMSAQNTLPNPNVDSCWSSLDALRACQLRAYNVAQDYAQRCTSYPEYQCLPADEPIAQEAAAKHAKRTGSQTTNTANPALNTPVGSDAGKQTATAK